MNPEPTSPGSLDVSPENPTGRSGQVSGDMVRLNVCRFKRELPLPGEDQDGRHPRLPSQFDIDELVADDI
jgi:hypothetical protein